MLEKQHTKFHNFENSHKPPKEPKKINIYKNKSKKPTTNKLKYHAKTSFFFSFFCTLPNFYMPKLTEQTINYCMSKKF